VKDEEQRLIAECLQGRTAAFGELVLKYQDRLFHSVFRLVGNAEDAYDVVQDAFLNAYQSLGSFKGGSQFFTWLYRIAVNTAITLKRKQKAVVSLHSGPQGDQAIEPADSESNRPDHLAEMAEEEKRLHEALGRLTEEHRAVAHHEGPGEHEVRGNGRDSRGARGNDPQPGCIGLGWS